MALTVPRRDELEVKERGAEAKVVLRSAHGVYRFQLAGWLQITHEHLAGPARGPMGRSRAC